MVTLELVPDEGNWAWGRNREMRRPKFITIHRMGSAPEEVWISVYANANTLAEGQSPIDLHLSQENAVEFARAILREANEL